MRSLHCQFWLARESTRSGSKTNRRQFPSTARRYCNNTATKSISAALDLGDLGRRPPRHRSDRPGPDPLYGQQPSLTSVSMPKKEIDHESRQICGALASVAFLCLDRQSSARTGGGNGPRISDQFLGGNGPLISDQFLGGNGPLISDQFHQWMASPNGLPWYQLPNQSLGMTPDPGGRCVTGPSQAAR